LLDLFGKDRDSVEVDAAIEAFSECPFDCVRGRVPGGIIIAEMKNCNFFSAELRFFEDLAAEYIDEREANPRQTNRGTPKLSVTSSITPAIASFSTQTSTYEIVSRTDCAGTCA
jgi:hypothetical protein